VPHVSVCAIHRATRVCLLTCLTLVGVPCLCRLCRNFHGHNDALDKILYDRGLWGAVAKLLGLPPGAELEIFQSIALLKLAGVGREKPWHQDQVKLFCALTRLQCSGEVAESLLLLTRTRSIERYMECSGEVAESLPLLTSTCSIERYMECSDKVPHVLPSFHSATNLTSFQRGLLQRNVEVLSFIYTTHLFYR
jgi:hypothetical protein